jgi:hypothetical protein
MRLEPVLFGFFTLCWLVALAVLALGRTLNSPLPISLYHLYGLAVFGGWLSGNVYVQRTARVPRDERLRSLLVYLLGPPGLLFLTHALSAYQSQVRVPLAPLYALGIYFVFFMVPVSFRHMAEPRGRG